MPSLIFRVEPIQFNSQCVAFTEWVSLLTLCLAPLIAHIASGTPSISYLAKQRPKWYDHLCHYNPTSVIWRYAAITDRRIRATCWGRHDLAASNAIFWTADGWQGGEEMVIAAAPYSLRSPEQTHVELFSLTILKTIITAMQGISALYMLIGSLTGQTGNFISKMGVDMIFYPLAVLGLLRLCATIWLTEDFEYGSRIDVSNQINRQTLPGLSTNDVDINMKLDEDLDPFLTTPYQPGPRFRTPGSSWPSRIFRTCYLLLVGSVWAMASLYFIPGIFTTYAIYTTTSFLVSLFYFIYLTISVILYTFYCFRGQTTSTIIPCISSIWYRVYTLLVMCVMFVLIIIASIETNRTPLGDYTSLTAPVKLDCTYRNRWWPLTNTASFWGLASEHEIVWDRNWQNYSGLPVTEKPENNASSEYKFWLYDFNGYCVGELQGLDS
ncbi:hypothetical protein BKA66DRAFT_440598 [Pyrenochaeta sp. MPI-SDFR-AT-0127]|nr:hypothetical protein BKA66DRAFT_440598 [Pyrenochaeta sp. MPI-SDFR-AT-0127]